MQECQITVVDFSDERMSKYEMDNEGLVEFLKDPREDWVACRWINVNGLSWDVIKELGNKHGLHRLAIEDLMNTRGRTKADWYSDHAFSKCLSLLFAIACEFFFIAIRLPRERGFKALTIELRSIAPMQNLSKIRQICREYCQNPSILDLDSKCFLTPVAQLHVPMQLLMLHALTNSRPIPWIPLLLGIVIELLPSQYANQHLTKQFS